jgi:hypothetical protein
MGLFRRKDERAIPKSGSKEFEEAVRGTSPPDEGRVETDEPAAEEAQPAPPTVERPDGTADEADQEAEEPEGPGRGKRALGALGRSILKPPNADGFGGGVSGAPPAKRKPKD